MPAEITHHLFGRTMLMRPDVPVLANRDTRDAFLLGNQGPDPLFYATRTLSLVNSKALGSALHRRGIERYLEIWRTLLSSGFLGTPAELEILKAYVSGFLCHYALDRTAHPLVYSYERAIVAAGVRGLEPRDSFFVHGQIEADLDVYLLYKLTGRTIEEYYLPKQALYSSHAALALIDTLYLAAARELDIPVPPGVFTVGVKDMRAAMRLLYSPGGTRRALLGFVERIFRRHSQLQAMSHRSAAAFEYWFANESNEPWPGGAAGDDPYPPAGFRARSSSQGNESYCQLFERALDIAAADIKAYFAGEPLENLCENLNFSGNYTGFCPASGGADLALTARSGHGERTECGQHGDRGEYGEHGEYGDCTGYVQHGERA